MPAAHMLLKMLAISAFCLPLTAWAEVGTIEKVGVGSTVKVMRAGASVRLKAGDELQAGDEITTDATTAVDIRLEDETLIRLGTNSAYRVQEDSKIHALMHRLITGVVRVLVKPTDRDHTDPKIKFRMYTQEGTIGVRGTEFVVTRTAGATRLKNLDGEVLFGAADANFAEVGNFQIVTRGFESSVAAGAKTATKPEKFDLKKYLDEVNSKTNASFGALAGNAGSGKTARYERTAVAAAPVAARTDSVSNGALIPAPTTAPVKPKAPAPVAPLVLQNELVAAVLANDKAGVIAALDKGANIDGKSSGGVTALEAAMSSAKDKNEFDLFSELVVRHADVELVDEMGLTPLMFCAKNKLSMDYVKSLVDPGGADPEQKVKGKTALDVATEAGYQEMVDYLENESGVEYQQAKQTLKSSRKAKKK